MVWLAERRTQITTTKVALKIPLDEEISLEAIRNEADLWVRASGHSNVLPIIEADIYGEYVVIASEYAPDGSLEGKLKTHGKMSIENSVETTMQILEGLEFLHSRNIIHRDLKPANILLQGRTPRLADFGISRVLKTTNPYSDPIGTLSYMAPEALRGKRDIQTDIWSVGVILYQLLTNDLPFSGYYRGETYTAIKNKKPKALPNFVPEKLKKIVIKSLEKKTERRYKTASEMRSSLEQFLKQIAEEAFQKTHTPKQTTVIRFDNFAQGLIRLIQFGISIFVLYLCYSNFTYIKNSIRNTVCPKGGTFCDSIFGKKDSAFSSQVYPLSTPTPLPTPTATPFNANILSPPTNTNAAANSAATNTTPKNIVTVDLGMNDSLAEALMRFRILNALDEKKVTMVTVNVKPTKITLSGRVLADEKKRLLKVIESERGCTEVFRTPKPPCLRVVDPSGLEIIKPLPFPKFIPFGQPLTNRPVIPTQ